MHMCPFRSERQRRYLWKNAPEVAEEFEREEELKKRRANRKSRSKRKSK